MKTERINPSYTAAILSIFLQWILILSDAAARATCTTDESSVLAGPEASYVIGASRSSAGGYTA